MSLGLTLQIIAVLMTVAGLVSVLRYRIAVGAVLIAGGFALGVLGTTAV